MREFQKVLVLLVFAGMFATAVAPESQTVKLAKALGGDTGFGGWLKTITVGDRR